MNITHDFGPYHVIRQLPSGGMAQLYLAQQNEHEPVIIKRIQRSLLNEPDSLKLFEHEAHLYARMQHPHIVKMIDLISDQDAFSIVLEYIQGQDLYAFIRNITSSNTAERLKIALPIICDLLDALRYAHGLKDLNGFPLYLVHRDVSPGNILITKNGQVKLCDFGIAKSRLTKTVTENGFTRGKLQYMSPEQIDGFLVDQRTDLFAVALCLHEILSGTALFEGKSAKEIRSGSYLKDISRVWVNEPIIQQLLIKGLQPNPKNRFQSADEFLAALKPNSRLSLTRQPPKRWAKWISRFLFAIFGPFALLLYRMTRR